MAPYRKASQDYFVSVTFIVSSSTFCILNSINDIPVPGRSGIRIQAEYNVLYIEEINYLQLPLQHISCWRYRCDKAVMLLILKNYNEYKKSISATIDRNLKKDYQILITCGKNIPDTTAHQMTF